MNYIINSNGIVLFLDNKPIKFEKSSRQYAQIVEKFDLPENEQEKAIREVIFNSPSSLDKNGFKATDEGVFYKGEKLPTALAEKVKNLHKEGLPLNLFEKFWQNIKENPSCSSVNELYEFLSYKELPITEDGCFLAYKGVDGSFWSISGNKDTKVVKGKVDNSGRIYNGIGERIEVVRRDVDDDRRNHCSHGLHVGSLDYASSFSRGKLVVVKVNPKDVVSVPTDYSCQKCRVSAYEVVSEFDAEIKAPAVDENNEPIINADSAARDAFVDRVDNYLRKMSEKGYSEVCVRKIQNSFSPEYPSRNRVLDALDDLGYFWHEDEHDGLVVELGD
jgi:hypothetical protein